MFANFIISFNQDGELMESMYLNPHLRFYYFQVDELGNKYFSESFQDTLVLGQDTILGPANPSWIYVAKLNPSVDEAIWYHIIPKQSGQTIWSLQIMLYQNRVLFSTTANKALIIGNANLWLGVYTKGVFGEFQENGEVANISLLSAEFNLHKFHSITDNCGNIIAGGDFLYKSIIANDTIFSYSSIITDAYIAKLQTGAPLFFDLGNDTTVCESYTLVGPAGYTTYIWNDSITTQNWWTVSETGGYVLQCANSQGCWAHDSIFVAVHAGIEVTMPVDTLVCINDSLSFTVDGSFESYLWSTGDTTNAIVFPATDLGPGSHWISLEITDGPCYLIDSLLLTVQPAIDVVLPSDTLVCSNELLFLSVPAGYEHYLWSTGDTTNSISIVAGSLGTGQQQLEISIQDGPCLFIDSLTVIIHPEIIAELPSDTSIKLHDSIVFSVPDTFEHYFWSTGDTTHTIQVEGMSIGIGSHLIYLEIWDGPCYFIDSLQLTVQDDYGINDQLGEDIEIIPNPSYDNISISSPIPLHFIEILDLEGKFVYSEELNKKAPTHYFFNLSGIGKGVYLIRIYFADSMITRKMIKL